MLTWRSCTAVGKMEQIAGIECYVATPEGDYPKDKVVLLLTNIFGIELINNRVRSPVITDEYDID